MLIFAQLVNKYPTFKRVHDSTILNRVLRQKNGVYILTPCFFKIPFKYPDLPSGVLLSDFPTKLCNGLCSSPSIVRVIKARRMRWAGHVARMGEVRGAYKILVGRPEGKRPLGRPRRRWEDNIKTDLREIGFGDVDWILWAQGRDRWRALVDTVMDLRVPYNTGNFLTS
jgi:hypothetical protein